MTAWIRNSKLLQIVLELIAVGHKDAYLGVVDRPSIAGSLTLKTLQAAPRQPERNKSQLWLNLSHWKNIAGAG